MRLGGLATTRMSALYLVATQLEILKAATDATEIWAMRISTTSLAMPNRADGNLLSTASDTRGDAGFL